MKPNFLFITYLLILIVVACKHDSAPPNSLQTINVAANINNFKQINLSQFTTEVRYVPLETREDALLSATTNFDISENFIVLTDGNSCLLYDLAGRFIRKFGTKGRGPEEYLGISNLTICKDNTIIFNSLVDLLEFNIDGTFSQRHSKCLDAGNGAALMNWHLIEDTLLLGVIDNLGGNERYKAMLINKNGVVKKQYQNYDILKSNNSRIYNGIPKLFEYNKTVFIKQQFNDTLFSINKTYDLIPEYVINLGNLKMPADIRAEFSEWARRMNEFLAVNSILMTPDYLFLAVFIPGKSQSNVLGIYDKKSKELLFSQPGESGNRLLANGIFNDIDAGPGFFPVKIINDNTMIMIIDAKELKSHVESDAFKDNIPKFPGKKSELEAIANNLTENDNPVMIFVTINNKN